MKLNWICGMLFAVALTSAAPAQVGVYIGRTPPPERYEERGAMPGPGYAWVDGYWAPNGHRYRWVAGRWDRPPYEGAYWNHPHYDHYQQGWRMHEGHWDHENHDAGRGHDGDHHDGEHHDH
jgi:WXXGXW repeat (2 copies)